MKRINIIRIDMCLLDEETGEFDFRANIDSEFIKDFGIDIDIFKRDLDKLIDNMIDNAKGDK